MAKTYGQKLKDPRWQRRRLEVMESAHFACDECGNTEETLNVHHKRYIRGREPWEYDDKYLACLCDTHHDAWHGMEQELKELIAITPGLLNAVVAYSRGYTRKVESVGPRRKSKAKKMEPEVEPVVDIDYVYSYLPKEERAEAAAKEEAEALRRSKLTPEELEAENEAAGKRFFTGLQKILEGLD